MIHHLLKFRIEIYGIEIITFILVLLVIIVLTHILEKHDENANFDNELILQIRKQQHLYNNKIASISNLTKLCTDYESLSRALNEYVATVDNSDADTYMFIHFKNKFLASLLYSKKNEASAKGISIKYQFRDFTFKNRCSDIELVDITGILLDNAVEASNADDTIYVTVSMDKSTKKYRLCVENPGPDVTPQFLNGIFSKDFTTKGEGHGLGLSILKEKLDKRNGDITVSNHTYEGIRYIVFEVIV